MTAQTLVKNLVRMLVFTVIMSAPAFAGRVETVIFEKLVEIPEDYELVSILSAANLARYSIRVSACFVEFNHLF